MPGMTNCHSGNLDHGGAAVGQVAYPRAAINEGAGIARVVEHLKDACGVWWCPQEFTLVGPRAQPPREQEALFPEEADGSDRASGPFEGLEYQAGGVLDLGIGIEADRPVGSVDQAARGG